MSRTGRVAVVIVATLAVLGGCSDDRGAPTSTAGDATTTTSSLPRGYESRLASAGCPDPSLPNDRITCHVLVLPEDRSLPEGRQVELPVLRSAPVGPDAGDAAERPAPIVVLHGGPGGGAVQAWATWSTALDDLGAELILYDQRGGGSATPTLDCPEHNQALLDALGAPEDPTIERAAATDAVDACHERLSDGGVGLDHYDTPTATQDLEDLRVALGVPELTLVASSYGTRLALDYLRTHPDRVHSLVLDSVDPPDADAASDGASRSAEAIDRLLDECATDPACAAAHPDLDDAVTRGLDDFDRHPRTVTTHDADGATRTLTLTGDDLYAGLFAAMYDTEVIPLLPSAIELLDDGDTALLDTVASRIVPALGATATGAFWSIDCADRGGATAGGTDVPDRASTLLLTGSRAFCPAWPVEPVARGFTDPLDIDDPPPTLVIAGELDPITPAEDSRRVAGTLDARLLVVPRGGHAPMLSDPCARTALRSFLADTTAPDPACAATLAPVPFA